MSSIDDCFEKLLGRQPSDKERQDLYRVKEALEIRSNDALWLVLMALQYYQTQYEKIPESIAETTRLVLEEVRKEATSTIRRSLECGKVEQGKAIEDCIGDVIRVGSPRYRIQSMIGTVGAVALVISVVFWFVHTKAYAAGVSKGYLDGYKEARDEKAADTWANTPEGQLAYLFSQAGSLQMVATCSGTGWYVEKGVCYARTAPDGRLYGWRLPTVK